MKIRKEIMQQAQGDSGVDSSDGKDQDKETDSYIKQSDKFPLESKRLGHLSLSLQKFFHFNNTSCYVNIRSSKLKQNEPCLVRHGIKQNQSHSFISALAFIFNEKTKSLNDMIDDIIHKVDLDTFLSLQNGSLATIFKSGDNTDNINVEAYSNTKIYKS